MRERLYLDYRQNIIFLYYRKCYWITGVSCYLNNLKAYDMISKIESFNLPFNIYYSVNSTYLFCYSYCNICFIDYKTICYSTANKSPRKRTNESILLSISREVRTRRSKTRETVCAWPMQLVGPSSRMFRIAG